MTVHIEDLPLRVHEKLTIISLNLNASHDHIVLHVDRDLLFTLSGSFVLVLIGLSVVVRVGVVELLLVVVVVVLVLGAVFNIHVILVVVVPPLVRIAVNRDSVVSLTGRVTSSLICLVVILIAVKRRW